MKARSSFTQFCWTRSDFGIVFCYGKTSILISCLVTCFLYSQMSSMRFTDKLWFLGYSRTQKLPLSVLLNHEEVLFVVQYNAKLNSCNLMFSVQQVALKVQYEYFKANIQTTDLCDILKKVQCLQREHYGLKKSKSQTTGQAEGNQANFFASQKICSMWHIVMPCPWSRSRRTMSPLKVRESWANSGRWVTWIGSRWEKWHGYSNRETTEEVELHRKSRPLRVFDLTCFIWRAKRDSIFTKKNLPMHLCRRQSSPCKFLLLWTIPTSVTIKLHNW